MSTLERRCWLLLSVYPAEYRRERGEEIPGTLLETTPQGRGWPLARDVVAARLWLFVGSSAVLGTGHETAASGWRELVAGLLIAAAVTCAWRGRRRQPGGLCAGGGCGSDLAADPPAGL
jgi:hypothetical protein